MGLSSMLKVIINHLKKPFIIFSSIWFVIGALLFIPFFGNNDNIISIILLTYLITSVLFILFTGVAIYGSYGNAFIFIQNNRKGFVLTALILGLTISLIFTLLAAFLRLNSLAASFLNPFSFSLGIMIFLFYLLVYYIGSLYGLFIKYKPFAKRLFFFIFSIALTIFGFFTIPLGIAFIASVVRYTEFDNNSLVLILLLLFNLISIVSCSIYYLKLNIIKAYSNE